MENRKYLLVSTDYFTKWVEAEPLANIRDVDVKRFIWENIVTRFGVPHVLISDNGLQFNNKMLEDTVVSWGLRIGILLLPITKGTDKQKLLIKS